MTVLINERLTIQRQLSPEEVTFLFYCSVCVYFVVGGVVLFVLFCFLRQGLSV